MSGLTGVVVAGGVAAAGTIGAAAINSGAAGDAADAQALAQRESIAYQREQAAKAEALQREFAALSRQDLEPFRQAQVDALGKLQGFTDPNSEFFQNERKTATEAIQRQLAAQGLLRSKNQVDLLSGLEADFTRQRLGVLGGIAGNGAAQGIASINSNLGSSLSNVYGNLGQQVGSSLANIGQAKAQGIMGNAQANAGTLTGIGNVFQSAVGNYYNMQQQQEMLALKKQLYGLGTGAAPAAGGLTGLGGSSRYPSPTF